MPNMDQTTFQTFINGPWIAHVVALQGDGTPHVAPVWYEYVGGQFLVFTPPASAKLKHISRDSRVAISIASEGEPYRYVTANGSAEIDQGDVRAQAISITRRYKGNGAEKFLEHLAELRLITITPVRFSTYIED